MTDDREPIPGGGWVKLYRCIQQNPMWTDKPFDRARAWVDLILLANHKDGHLLKRGIKIDIKRGQVGWSERALAERWGWSRGKIRRFLNELKMEQQIDPQNGPQKNNITSLITISNYEKYQGDGPQNGPQNGPQTVPQTVPGTRSKEKTYIGGGSFFHDTEMIPLWVPLSEWADFVQMRQEIKKPLTSAGVKKAVVKLDELRKQGYQPGDVLNQSTLNNWQGLFPLKGEIPQPAESTQPRRKLELAL